MRRGSRPNPCVECNRHVKFDRLLHRALQLGFDAIATGHHVRRVELGSGRFGIGRAVDEAKDQSYVVHMLGQDVMQRCLFPVGELTKADVRQRAGALGLRTADKPDSQDVCFIARTNGGRRTFLGSRIELRSATVHDTAGVQVGTTDAVELVTIGQRRGVGVWPWASVAMWSMWMSPGARSSSVAPDDLLSDDVRLADVTWVADAPADGAEVLVQTSAHGQVHAGTVSSGGSLVRFQVPVRRVAPGQSVVLYRGDLVLGGGIAQR